MRLLPTASALSPARQKLVRLIQHINFGKLVNLHVRGGEPVFHPPPKVTRDIAFRAGADNGPHPDVYLRDSILRAQHLELFRQLDQLGDGLVEQISVADGLPARMTVGLPVVV